MTTNNELNRMIMNVEKAITKVVNSINLLPNVCSGKQKDLDPDTGLRKDFLQLSRRKSLFIKISTKLEKQHLENTIKQRKEQLNEI
jgi:hypothetical protein